MSGTYIFHRATLDYMGWSWFYMSAFFWQIEPIIGWSSLHPQNDTSQQISFIIHRKMCTIFGPLSIHFSTNIWRPTNNYNNNNRYMCNLMDVINVCEQNQHRNHTITLCIWAFYLEWLSTLFVYFQNSNIFWEEKNWSQKHNIDNINIV